LEVLAKYIIFQAIKEENKELFQFEFWKKDGKEYFEFSIDKTDLKKKAI